MATFLTDTDFRIPSSGGTLDLDALVELSNRRRRTMEEARANVDRRRRDLMDVGALGYQPVANPVEAGNAMMRRLPEAQSAQIMGTGNPSKVKEIPGVGRAVKTDGGVAMMGRYGTGVATQRKEPDPNRKIEGVPAAEWFAKKAAEQGVSNRFATAAPTGKTDEWGRPTYTGKAVVQEAMKKKKA